MIFSAFVAGLSRISERGMLQRRVGVSLCSPSPSCFNWQCRRHGHSVYGFYERKVPKRYVPLFPPSRSLARESQGCTAVNCRRSTGTVSKWPYFTWEWACNVFMMTDDYETLLWTGVAHCVTRRVESGNLAIRNNTLHVKTCTRLVRWDSCFMRG